MFNVMIVEDELLVRSGMRTLVDWQAHGFRLAAEAAHGQDALDILERQPIDIVITDIRMPVMDGLQLIERIRERNLPCEIIVLSSYDDFDYVRKAMKLDVKDYIHKPTMNIDELMATLNKVASVLQSRLAMDGYRQIILDTVEQSREILVNQFVKHALHENVVDEKLIELLKDVYLANEPFHVAMLKFCDSPKRSASAIAEKPFDPEQVMRAYVRMRGEPSDKPAFAYREDSFWVVLFAIEDSRLPEDLEEAVACEHSSVRTIWERGSEPVSIRQLPDTLSGIAAELNRRFDQIVLQQSLHPLIQDSLVYIHEHYMDSLTLEKVSSVVHASPVYLSRLFYKEIGTTFIDYLTDYRVEKAKMLLLRTDLRTYEIADQVGYKNSKYFMRVFKSLVGQTAGEFRESRRGT